jgi:thiosulfate/3-mercaptopyruvate sulfurtransferase
MTDHSREALVEVDDLLAAFDDPSIRIADVRWFLGEPERGQLEYQRAHIPGAIFVDLDRDLAAAPGAGRHPLPDPTAFADRMGQLGFGDEHTIVIHDAHGGQYGARLWWMLDRLGHPSVFMLDGGLEAWQAGGGELTAERTSHLRATMTLLDTWRNIIDREGVAASIDSIDLVDVRSPERYTGESEPIERVAGHIPGARNRPCASMLDAAGRMLPPDQLRTLIRGDGARATLPLVLSCGSGVTACFGLLAARVAGLPDPILYPGSYSDWVGSGMPVATGPEPGSAPAQG